MFTMFFYILAPVVVVLAVLVYYEFFKNGI